MSPSINFIEDCIQFMSLAATTMLEWLMVYSFFFIISADYAMVIQNIMKCGGNSMSFMKSRTEKFMNAPALNVLRALVVYSSCAALVACGGPPVQPVQNITASAALSPVVSTNRQTLSASELPPPAEEGPYRLGPNDVISVTVYMHPELSIPQPGNTGGAMITSDGSVSLPLIGNIDVDGLTIDQAQQKINAAYAANVKNPNVAVQLVTAQSLRYYLLGAFSAPGVKYPGRQLSLLDALSLGGSVDFSNADLYQAYVVRGSEKLPIDFHALLAEGDLTQDYPLEPGDTIVIPAASAEDAFVFGTVGKPGAVPFQAGSLSLPQALSVAGMDLQNYTNSELSQVRVIRSHGASADLMIVNVTSILRGEAVPFPLQPGDIVFVPPNGIGTWNQVLTQLLPSLQTINGLLNPFVSIAYLSRNTRN
jgi:polysaccharide biosynthesis/export protein